MALVVKEIVNKTDAELDVVDMVKKTVEPVAPHSAKSVPDENLLDLAFVSKTARPIYIRIKSIIGDGDGDIGNGDDQVEVVVGDDEEEIEDL